MREQHRATWQQRTEAERAQLVERIERLKGFIQSDRHATLSPHMRRLLDLQLRTMTIYRDLLTERLMSDRQTPSSG